MFCSECGAAAQGKFCSACGAQLPTGDDVPRDWSEVVDYQVLLRIPAVRDRLARNAAQAKKKLTGEEFLDTYGNALGKLSGLPISLPMARLAHFAQNTYAKLGVKTGKTRIGFVARPTGTVLVELLCWLARNGRTLRGVEQLAEGCLIVAALPSDLFALEGDLVIEATRGRGGTQIQACTEIPGQMFDWGKSTRCLEALFAELSAAVAA